MGSCDYMTGSMVRISKMVQTKTQLRVECFHLRLGIIPNYQLITSRSDGIRPFIVCFLLRRKMRIFDFFFQIKTQL